ncbi:hypothetical protein LP420_16385 [Massilia sp. B-10]|nr:hypothetical protein LP420_16385 [Massilia sp. B-10]UUZ56511.1 hypothetical protein LP419_15875 [Massilia sp. H-1]
MAWSLGADISRTVTDYEARLDDKIDGPNAARRTTLDRSARTITRFGLSPRLTWKMDGGDSLAWQALLERARDDSLGGASETLISGVPTTYPENNFSIHSTIAAVRSDLTWTHQAGEDGKLLVKA